MLVFTGAMVVRAITMLALQSWEFENQWAFGYEMGKLGESLVSGKGFVLRESVTAVFPPLYPIVVSAFFSVFGIYSQTSAIGIFIFQSICAGVTAVLLMAIGACLWNRAAGLLAGVIWVFYPTSIFYSVVRIWYCELAIMLLLLAILIAVTASSPVSAWRVALLGAVSGLGILADSTLTVYLATLLIWMLFVQRTQFQRLAALVPVWAFSFAIIVSPWAIHNWVFLGSPIIIKSNFGREFFVGNLPRSERKSSMFAGEATQGSFMRPKAAKYKEESEISYDRYLFARTTDWIHNNPLNFAHLTSKRMRYFWFNNPSLGRSGWLRLTYQGPLLALAVYGLWLAVRRRSHSAPVWLFLLIYPIPFYLTHVTNGRYSYPVEPFVALLAAVPLAIWFKPIYAVQKKLLVESGEKVEVRG